MPNTLALLDKSSIIKDRIKGVLSDIEEAISTGFLPNKTMAFLWLRNYIDNLLTSYTFSMPSMEIRPIHLLPSLQDMSYTCTTSIDDLNRLMSSINSKTEIFRSILNEVLIAENWMLNATNRIAVELAKEIDERADSIAEGDGNYLIHRETFHSYNNADVYKSSWVEINREVPNLTLGLVTNTMYNNVDISILDGSTGFPGDTHQAESILSQIRNTGNTNPHLLLSSITDLNDLTWFEYESIKVADKDIAHTEGYGFSYSDGIKWITDRNNLTLRLYIEVVNTNALINFIKINPYIPPDGSYTPSKITSIIVDNGAGLRNEICKNGSISFGNTVSMMIDMSSVKSITITFVQDKAYRATISHDFYSQINISSNILDSNSVKTIRVDGPNKSIETIGMKYNPVTGEYINPNTKDATTLDYNKIFDKPSSNPSMTSNRELLYAKRFQIGIREVSLRSMEFIEYGQYVSYPFVFNTGVSSLLLIVKDEIPEVFEGSVDDWIEYWALINESDNWRRVTPARASQTGLVLTNQTAITTVRIKILLKRPTTNYSMKYKSPIVYNYSIRGNL